MILLVGALTGFVGWIAGIALGIIWGNPTAGGWLGAIIGALIGISGFVNDVNK